MGNDRQLSSVQKNWNKHVEEKARVVKELQSWLKSQKVLKGSTWYDQVRAIRARSYLELALAEIRSMEYAEPNEIHGYLRDEFPWAK
jgi:hypothetical protein